MHSQIKDTIQDCNLNFLLGSGLSRPFLPTLGNVETLLTAVEAANLPADKAALIRASVCKHYFDGVMSKNPEILHDAADAKAVLENYQAFLKCVNSILLRRKSTILSKEVNIFTTNVDIFLEKALEDLGLEFNDGFNGRFKPSFDLNNFKKSRFKKSLHYDNTAEIPVFNLLKLHGSLCWCIEKNQKIIFSCDLAHVKAIEELPVSANILAVADDATVEDLQVATESKAMDAAVTTFMEAYEKLLIVNPTKEKFKQTLLNRIYYELLRLYSNELEKENTVLFVMGFSFADEHIREITLRAANSNPTLVIYVIAHSSLAKAEIESRFPATCMTNENIIFIAPPQKDPPKGGGPAPADNDAYKYDLAGINEHIFGTLFTDEDEPSADSPASAPTASTLP